MSQDLDSIIRELDASYNPSRQSINDRIGALQGQEQADLAGLKGQQTEAFDGITQSAIGRGTFYGGAPISEQQKFTSTQFLPAVAQLKGKYVGQRQSLGDALNDINLDQRKTAMGVQQNREQQAFAAEQARLQREDQLRQERAALAAANSGSNSLASLFGGGEQQKADPYATVNKQGATNAIVGLLKSGNIANINATIKAIQDSASRGNQYDKYKLDLINNYKQTAYGSVINKALSFKPAASSGLKVGVAKPTQRIVF